MNVSETHVRGRFAALLPHILPFAVPSLPVFECEACAGGVILLMGMTQVLLLGIRMCSATVWLKVKGLW